MSTATANGKYKVIGTRPIRHDGADKVTGRAKYGADLNLTGMLAGYVLRSPHAHAKIRSIDTSKARIPSLRFRSRAHAPWSDRLISATLGITRPPSPARPSGSRR